MNLQHVISVAVLGTMTLWASLAQAQAPYVAGEYLSEKGQHATVLQQGDSVSVSVHIPNVATAVFYGTYKQIEFSDGSRGMAFVGNFLTHFDDDRPHVGGVSYLIPMANGQLACDTFIVEESVVQPGVRAILSPIREPNVTPPPRPANDSPTQPRQSFSTSNFPTSSGPSNVSKTELRSGDEFELLPTQGLDRLGL